MADRIICQHDPLQPACSLIFESGIVGRRIRCRACDVAALAKSDGTFKCSPYTSYTKPDASAVERAREQYRKHGHGHVVPRDDGTVMRCGGPAYCKVCSLEKTAIGD